MKNTITNKYFFLKIISIFIIFFASSNTSFASISISSSNVVMGDSNKLTGDTLNFTVNSTRQDENSIDVVVRQRWGGKRTISKEFISTIKNSSGGYVFTNSIDISTLKYGPSEFYLTITTPAGGAAEFDFQQIFTASNTGTVTPEIKSGSMSVGEKLLVFRYKSASATFKVWVGPAAFGNGQVLIPEKTFDRSPTENETLGTLVSVDISNLAPKTQFNVIVKDGNSTIEKLFSTPETTKSASTAKIKGNPVIKSKKMSFQIESSTKSVVWEVRIGSLVGTTKIGPKTETIPATQNYIEVKDVDLSVITGNNFWLIVKDAGASAGINNEDSRNLSTTDTPPEEKKEEVIPQKTPILENDYRLLAPIPGMSEVISRDNQIGDYINTMFNIFLGLCAALAVIMIIIKGIQWMGTDSVFGKTEAKSEIASAIGGLLLALGAWALLNTINPDLLGGRLDIKQVDITIDSDIHGDDPQTAQGGKYCKGKYAAGESWPDDKSTRDLLTSKSIKINKANCKEGVGDKDPSCTSVYGLNTAKIIKLKEMCGAGCEIEITGGTECWFHSSRTEHVPGSSIVDLNFSNSPNLVKYIESGKKNTVKWTNGGTAAMFTKDGMKFVKESDHYHVYSW